MIECKKCNTLTDEYYVRPKLICKACVKLERKEHYEKKRDSVRERQKEYYNDNLHFHKSRMKTYRQENKLKIQENSKIYSKKHYEENKPEYTAKAAKRRATSLQATPVWLSDTQKDEINSFYNLARDCYLTSGQEYHVDHIIPLQGQNVCGLHVPWNLQVLPKDVNLSKGNR